MSTQLFGEKVPRVEDQRFLRGQGRYVDDVLVDTPSATLHAAVLRSPHAHARILDIDVSDVIDMDGVHLVWTHEDLAGAMAEPLPLLIPHPALTHGRTQYTLAKDTVNYVGEAVAFVVADDRYLAEDALGRISVSYEPLPAVVGIESARAAENLVHDDVPGNVAARMEQNVGDAPTAIDAAPHVLELDLSIERSAAMPLEGRGTVARWDHDTSRLQVWTSTQASTGVRAAVAAKLELDLGQVDVICPDTGGGFGVKINHPWPEDLLVTRAAQVTGQAVKFTEDRREHFISAAHERAQEHHIRVGFDDQGRVQGLDVEFWHDNGAYTPYGLIVPIITSTQLLGPYKPANYRVRFDSLYTNTVIVTPYRGAGRPQGCFAMERTIDAIAAHLGLDRTAVRAANLIQPDEFPYDQGLIFQDGRPLIYDSGDYPAMLEKIRKLIGWDEFEQFKAEAEAEGRRVGIGLGCYVEGTGVGPYEGAHVHVETSGKVKVATGLTTQGQGHQTAFAQVVADTLDVPMEDVEVVTGDTRRMSYSVGTFASRAAVMSGSAMHLAALRAKEKALRLAADALEADEADLKMVDGSVQVKGSPSNSIALGTLAVLSNPLRYAFDKASQAATQFSVGDQDKPPVDEDDEPGLEGRDFYSPNRSTFASGMHAAIVETDPETAEIKILRYAIVHDCGRMINPMIVEGQIHGGMAQGIGGALYERMAYDDSGQLLNASFMDFLMPYVTEIPGEIDVDHLETPSPLNPLGIKGAGEAGVIPVSAAIAAAVENAEGFSITSMPISPAELYDLRQRHAEHTSTTSARPPKQDGSGEESA
ncbi:carbon-monoxide dehydrogenase large subunit [Halopolyspora algeriensis]|uniref:Carbon-monoxide dehydrogenase large subunit n=1 Tax=Halopolyspora algeriensis TaxID=1500506 RepID=A0A368VZV9_9ACTN|nr:aerobic carbon-monoxide dehydrogenase large subunit [Halopolyspora algeriensis]RCW45871.1 carbon-monoxide dehydrogenase large subunit [Halopolyspora algeriensis]TQM55285.1 carbon-monoxide dehydrogenase large subunit [Halopolyspora algeriensis]